MRVPVTCASHNIGVPCELLTQSGAAEKLRAPDVGLWLGVVAESKGMAAILGGMLNTDERRYEPKQVWWR